MLGVICGLESEALIARRIKDAKVMVTAARPEKAQEAAYQLVQEGATRLLSFGLAAGLSPKLRGGALVIGSAVRTPIEIRYADENWILRLKRKLPNAVCGDVWGTDDLIHNAEEKRSLFRDHGCLVADMESHQVAEAAVSARIPFLVIRAVVDTASVNLPPAARVPLKSDGRIDGGAVIQSLARTPLQIFSLIGLGISTRRAMRVLELSTRYIL